MNRPDAEYGGAYFATLDGKDWDTLPEEPLCAWWNRLWIARTSKREYRQAWVEAGKYGKRVGDKYEAARRAAEKAQASNLNRT